MAFSVVAASAADADPLADVPTELVEVERHALDLALNAVDVAMAAGWLEESPTVLQDTGSVSDDWAEEPVSLGSLVVPAPAHDQAQYFRESALAKKLLKSSLGYANAAALSEAESKDHVIAWQEEPGDNVELGTYDVAQGGGCGFTVVLRRPQKDVGTLDACSSCSASRRASIGMCHHFTWDGKHCVSSRLSSEHANRCVGHLYVVGAAAESQLCRTVGLQRACSRQGDLGFVETACGPPQTCHVAYSRRGRSQRPAPLVCCRDTCPFIGEGAMCPYTLEHPAGSDSFGGGVSSVLFSL